MFLFHFKEALKSFGRAKLATFISLITACIAILLVTASAVLILYSGIMQDKIKERVSVNLFLQDSLKENDIQNFIASLKEKPFVNSLNYIDKNTARKEFIKQTGNDFTEVLQYNPLPASIELKLKSNYVVQDSISGIKKTLAGFEEVDEVILQNDVVNKLISVLDSVRNYIFIGAGILLLIAFYIVFSTNKLIINAKTQQIETMKLVGAKLSTIKFPIILNGIFIGILASIFAAILFFLILQYFKTDVSKLETSQSLTAIVYLVIILTGPAIGFLGSYFATRGISLKIKKI